MGVILNNEGRTLFEVVNFVFISGLIGLFGVTSNIINVIIFNKQGLTKYANVGFFGLAISDIICLIALIWSSILLNPLFASTHIPWNSFEIMYLTGACPHVCFTRITSFITVYITAERYFSIAFPLKVKDMLTPKTSTLTLSLIYIVNMVTYIPEYATSYLDWKIITPRNETVIGILFTGSRNNVQGVIYVFHTLLGMTSFAGVVVFTTLLVIKLRQSSQWRVNVTCGYRNNENISNKDKRTVKMVVLIASVLIACYIPGAIIASVTFIVGPEFNVTGRYVNYFRAMWSIACACQCINSSVNIFIYYTMSSKYRQTFQEIFLQSKM